jgi:hypothetical protein
VSVPAAHIDTDWYLALPVQYRDRVSFDPASGYPSCIDVAAGAYTVPGALTDDDRVLCGLPPLLVHATGRR